MRHVFIANIVKAAFFIAKTDNLLLSIFVYTKLKKMVYAPLTALNLSQPHLGTRQL